MSSWKIIAFYLIYLLFQFFGFFCYFKGFFKLKHESKSQSTFYNPFLNQSQWFPPSFNKSIWMIIDGLRYDFAFNKDNFTGEEQPFYVNQMPIISELLKEKKDNTLFFQAYSDPPTVTTQRIKSLTTGNLPSFLDFADNFDGKEVEIHFYINIVTLLII